MPFLEDDTTDQHERRITQLRRYQREFWMHVDRQAPDSCWLWLGNEHPCGYGMFQLRGNKSGWLTARLGCLRMARLRVGSMYSTVATILHA